MIRLELFRTDPVQTWSPAYDKSKGLLITDASKVHAVYSLNPRMSCRVCRMLVPNFEETRWNKSLCTLNKISLHTILTIGSFRLDVNEDM